LQGARLEDAKLQGADLRFARLQGADLAGAWLQGARLDDAQMQGAVLKGAHLQGAVLVSAQLQGADLTEAQLQGANLSNAQLQGANLSGADMEDSALVGTFIFRANVADADLSTAATRSLRVDQVKKDYDEKIKPLSLPDVEAWIAAAQQFVPETAKAVITAEFARLKPDFHDDEQQATWPGMEEASLALDPDGARHRQRLAVLLGDLACDPDSAPHLARGLIQNDRLAALQDQLGPVRERMKAGRREPDKCRGVDGFAEHDWRALDTIKPY
jgi:hypothetical protein